MRNLRNTRHDRFRLAETTTSIAAVTWDPTDDSLIFATGPSEEDDQITIKRLPSTAPNLEDAFPLASWSAPSPTPNLPHDKILDLHAFPDDETIVLILAGGDIVVVSTSPSAPNAIEIAGSVDKGLAAASWSPDEELLVLVTSPSTSGEDGTSDDRTLLVMTRTFETLASTPLTPADLSVSAHVSVGWGKVETQFHGRGAAGKARRDPTLPDKVEKGVLSTYDDPGKVRVSWRGDGECFALSAVVAGGAQTSLRRVVRVFTREGVLEGVSEPVDGLEGALSWKPTGSLIAGIQRLEKRVDVVFFERNGLRHGEFALRLSADELRSIGAEIDLLWNADSSVLAVAMKGCFQLWTMGNYHYYLKQEIRLNDSPSTLTHCLWHPERALQLCVFNSSDLQRLTYNLEVCRGSVTAPYDQGLVAVIDGTILKVTPLRIANVPPPMAFDEVVLPTAAVDVAIHSSGKEIAVLLADGAFTRLRCDYGSKPVKKPKILGTEANGDDGMVDSELVTRTDHDRIYYQTDSRIDTSDLDESVAQVTSTDAMHASWISPSFSQITFTLNENGALQIETDVQTLRIPNCTSFIITPAHLIYTTSQHLLKFIHLHEGQLEIPADEPEKDERCRSIERGARIVTVIPSAYSLILQMPRGNLETIYPRALVLAGIRQSLRARDYKKAFAVCRTQRVDMNLLYDYAPVKFMADVEIVVAQLKRTEYVDLLLSSLSEEDVTKTIYRETSSMLSTTTAFPGRENDETAMSGRPSESKVNAICDAFLRVLGKSPEPPLQNIITAHVCKNPPDLEAGLQLVSKLRQEKEETRLEQAVEHICFLADINRLYETALGLYDLDVALLVAQQSQKDPREYLPYLQGLHEKSELRKRFAIDNDLKRFSKALAHLHSLEEFDELKDYMSKHDLYTAALELYRYDDMGITDLMRLYADHLLSRNRFKEAGIAYEFITDHTAAYEAYRAVGAWRECLSNAAAVPLSPSDLRSLASDLANNAEEAKDYASAATIQQDYLSDLESAIKNWCKGHHFAEAMRQATLHSQPILQRTIIDPALIESTGTMTELLSEMKAQLQAQVPRFHELRLKQLSDPLAFLDGSHTNMGAEHDFSDTISLAATDASTSGGTFMTRYTRAGSAGTAVTGVSRQTSKNRRREERKRARGKKGTVYEAEYLVSSIARLVERVNDSVGEDVGRLLEALLRRGMRERAKALDGGFREVLALCQMAIEEVFVGSEKSEGLDGEAGTGDPALRRPERGQGVLFDALHAPTRPPPVLKAFERLGLMGG